MLEFLAFLVYLAFFIPLLRTIVVSIQRGRAEPWPRWRFGILFGITGALFLSLVLWALGIWTEVLWFDHLGYASVFWTVFRSQWLLFLVAGGLFFVFAKLNAVLATRFAPPFPEYVPDESPLKGWVREKWRGSSRVVDILRDVALIIMAVLMAVWAKNQWEQILLWLNQVPFHTSDPIFGKDVGFYVFTLPVYGFFTGWILVALILTFIVVAGLYGFYAARTLTLQGKEAIRPLMRRCFPHLAFLGVGIIALLIAKTILAIWRILYSERGVVFGASYTDVHAQIIAYKVHIAVMIIVAGLVVLSAFRRDLKTALWAGASWFGVWLLVVNIYPALVQQFSVKPSELAKEMPYIRHNIALTRQAYGLDRIEERDFEAVPNLTRETLERNRVTLDNIRLWDWRALWDTYRQIQEIRLYYEFDDVDIDRYILNGQYRQVMLAPRELPVDQLPARSRTWINERFKYTHGFGLCLNAVNEFTSEGLPRLLIKDMPPVSLVPELKIARPEIYYGERTNEHVFVNTKTEEFDYPRGDENVYTTYKGTGGVRLGSFLRKFAFAWRFDGIRVLLSEYLTPQSRILFHRNIKERVQTLAPFLLYDRDPYMVIDSGGRLWWMWDAYTTSEHYPYSEHYTGSLKTDRRLNYIRNSVKLTIDAYNGTVTFYVFDPGDPLIQAYRRIFPELFKPQEEMPADLKQHIRYPEDLFTIQAEMYAIYHMGDPQVFYNKEDLWEIAKETYIGNVQRVLPYYVIMRLPDEDREEFIQMVPFTPTRKNNMIAWMAGRCDGENYGKLLVFKFPKERLIYGPMQIEARIDQDREISAQLTLWGQLGSRVIRGNLLVIPFENSLLYVEPLYLQAEQSQMPELKQIIVAIGDRLAWGRTLEEALERVLRGRAAEAALALAEATPDIPGRTVEELIRSALDHFRRYQELTGQGKLLEAGQELQALGNDLEELSKLKP